jgi:Flp pilus assembly protein TadG
MQFGAAMMLSGWKYCRTRMGSVSQISGRIVVEGRLRRLLQHFLRDQSGSYVLVVALMMPVLVGTAGLGTEAVWWLYKHKNMQSAADSGAVSAATAATNLTDQANSVTASYGYANGVNNVTVTVNQPPTTGNFTKNNGAVEVIVSQPQPRLLSALFGTGDVPITARAVALSNPGTDCVLALNRTANSAVNVTGSNTLNLAGCNVVSDSNNSPSLNVSGSATVTVNQALAVGTISGTITATNGVRTGIQPVQDPYGPPPPTPSPCNGKISGKITSLSPGCYPGGITVNGGATLDLTPGVYYLYGSNGGLSVLGGASLTCSTCTGGQGVTLVFTGSISDGWASAKIAANANVNLTAPSSGLTKGIVFYGDRNMTVGTAFSLEGGGSQVITGAIDLPNASLKFAGSSGTSTPCTQIIADTIQFTGASSIQVNCKGVGTKSIGVQTAQLVE